MCIYFLKESVISIVIQKKRIVNIDFFPSEVLPVNHSQDRTI